MHTSLIILIVVVAFFAYRGYRHGLLKSLSRISSLVAGYLAAILYTRPVSALLAMQYPLADIAALMIASVALFIGAGIAVSLVFWLIKKIITEKENPSAISSIGGATTGVVTGLLVAIVIVWVFAFVRDMGAPENTAGIEDTDNNSIENIAGKVIGTAVKKVMSGSDAQPEVVNISGALIESPADMAKTVQRLSASNDLQALLQSPQNQRVLDSGDVRALQNLPAFQKLAKNPDLMVMLKSAGMAQDSDHNNKAAEVALANSMSELWLRMQQVKNDPRVQKIMNDPEFQQNIQSGNALSLLTDTRLLELADILFSASAKPDKPALTGSKTSAQGTPVKKLYDKELPDKELNDKERAVHQWVDKYGRIHFSDKQQQATGF